MIDGQPVTEGIAGGVYSAAAGLSAISGPTRNDGLPLKNDQAGSESGYGAVRQRFIPTGTRVLSGLTVPRGIRTGRFAGKKGFTMFRTSSLGRFGPF